MATSIETISKEMKRLSTILEEAKRQEARLTGQLEVAMERLQKEEGLSTIEDAEAEVKKLEKEESMLLLTISAKFEKLQEAYEW